MMTDSRHTDFGFEKVTPREKTRRVRAVFESVAPSYDLMNDLMSFGLHRLWKRHAITLANIRPGQRVLDLAAGTGDLTRLIHARVGHSGRVVMSDINAAMLARGRDRLIDEGRVQGIDYVQASAESLPFAAGSFDRVCIAFGLRNVTDQPAALKSAWQCLRYGGVYVVLEFSRLLLHSLEPLYDTYSFRCLPWLGQRVATDADSYRYLAESIRRHPDQATLTAMLQTAGFGHVDCSNLAGGIVALHRAYKI